MNSEEYHFASSHEIEQRRDQLNRLIDVLAAADERPFFTSDDATVFEVSYDMPVEIIAKLRRHYGKELTIEQLNLPIWKLLDILEAG